MNKFHTQKKPTVSSSFYDSYTNKPVKWYEVVDSYRQYSETYLPMRLENFPRELLNSFKNFFKSEEKTEEVDDDDPVNELERTRPDGNIVKITEYDLSKDNFNPKISDAVRTHGEKQLTQPSRQSFRPPQPQHDSRLRSTPSPRPERRRRHRHSSRISPTYDDCPECRALAAQGFPTMCDCVECRMKRAAYPNQMPYCNCAECRNTQRHY